MRPVTGLTNSASFGPNVLISFCIASIDSTGLTVGTSGQRKALQMLALDRQLAGLASRPGRNAIGGHLVQP